MDANFKSLQLIDTDLDMVNTKMTLIYLAKDWKDERYIIKVKDINMNSLNLRQDSTVEYLYSEFIKNNHCKTTLELHVKEGFEIIKI